MEIITNEKEIEKLKIESRMADLEDSQKTLFEMIETQTNLIENLNRRCDILHEAIEKLTDGLLN